MDTVRKILESKGGEIVSVDPDSTLKEALDVMAERNVGAVLVIGREGRVEGIFSERDFARKSTSAGRTIELTKVSEIMTSQVLYVSPDATIPDCMSLMTERKIRHLPVLANGRLMGVISIGDVVKALIMDQAALISAQATQINMLNSYMFGSP